MKDISTELQNRMKEEIGKKKGGGNSTEHRRESREKSRR